MAPISLLLRVLKRVTINLTGTGQQEASSNSLCQAQHVQGTHHICLVFMVKNLKQMS